MLKFLLLWPAWGTVWVIWATDCELYWHLQDVTYICLSCNKLHDLTSTATCANTNLCGFQRNNSPVRRNNFFSAIPVKVRGGYSDVSVHVQRGKEELGKQNASRKGLWTLKPPNNGCALGRPAVKTSRRRWVNSNITQKERLFFFFKEKKKKKKEKTQRKFTHTHIYTETDAEAAQKD